MVKYDGRKKVRTVNITPFLLVIIAVWLVFMFCYKSYYGVFPKIFGYTLYECNIGNDEKGIETGDWVVIKDGYNSDIGTVVKSPIGNYCIVYDDAYEYDIYGGVVFKIPKFNEIVEYISDIMNSVMSKIGYGNT